MNTNTIEEGKSLAILSYITFIGTIIVFFMNRQKQNPFVSFHIRQMIGLMAIWLVSDLAFYASVSLGFLIWIFGVALWIIGIFYAIKGEAKTVPFLGDKFQEWFINIK